MAREEKDILYFRDDFLPEDEVQTATVEELEEGIEHHLGYHNFYGY